MCVSLICVVGSLSVCTGNTKKYTLTYSLYYKLVSTCIWFEGATADFARVCVICCAGRAKRTVNVLHNLAQQRSTSTPKAAHKQRHIPEVHTSVVCCGAALHCITLHCFASFLFMPRFRFFDIYIWWRW